MKQKEGRKIAAALVKLFGVVIPLGPGYFAAALLFFLVLAFLPIIQLYMTKLIVDQVTLIFSEGEVHLRDGMELLAVQLVLFLANPLLTYLGGLLRFRWLQRINYHFEREVTQKALRVPLLTYESPEFYNHLNRATSGLGSKSVNVLEQMLAIFRDSITLIGFAVVLLSIHPLLFGCMLGFMLPTLLAHCRMGVSKFGQLKYQTPSFRRQHYLQHIMRSREASKELRVFGHGSYLLSVWRRIFWNNAEEQYTLEKKFVRAKLAADGISHTGSILLIGSCIWIGARGSMTIGAYVSLYQAVISSQMLLQQAARGIGSIYEDALHMHDVFKLLDFQEEVQADKLRPSSDRIAFEHELRAEEVCFRYPSRTAYTLKGINLSIRKGEKLAIVGDNGAGKSTLAKCLLGLYPPASGHLKIDGRLIDGSMSAQWREETTAAFQDFVKYYLTVRENIGISRLDQLEDEAKIKAAAEAAGADEMIGRLPEQYDALLGTPFVGGLELSGGLWQKIALSRAFFRDSAFIVLDEPTAALDPMAEADLLGKFMKIVEDRTAVIVTHRLGCCMHVDRIVVMKDGQIVEEGDHKSLLAKNGEYARMFQAQAQWYRDAHPAAAETAV